MNNNSYGKGTPNRISDKKNSTVQQQPEKVQTSSLTNSQMVKKQFDQLQVQKAQLKPQEQDKQQIEQALDEYKEKVFEELKKINQTQQQELIKENQEFKKKIEQQDKKMQQIEQLIQQQNEKIQQQELIKGNQEILKKMELQDLKIQQQDQKIQQLEEKIQQQELKIESPMQNQGNTEIQEKIQNFISKNEIAHEIWRTTAEKVSNAYGIIEKQSQDLDIYKKQIAEKVNEYNINMTQLVKDELKTLEQQLNQTQQQTGYNLENLSRYEQILIKYCEEINKCLNIQGIQVPNYNNNQFQQFNQQQQPQYSQQLDQQQYSQLQQDQYQYQQQQYQQSLDQQQNSQPIHSQINFITPQYQQSSPNYNQNTQNDTNSQIQFVPNYQDSQLLQFPYNIYQQFYLIEFGSKMIQYSQQQNSKKQDQQHINKSQFDYSTLKDPQKNKTHKESSKQNFQSIFDNLIILLKDLKSKQIKIQQYVQKEIIAMNEQLDNIQKQLSLAVLQFQREQNLDNATESLVNVSAQNFFNQSLYSRINNEIIPNKQQQFGNHINDSNFSIQLKKQNTSDILQQKYLSQSKLIQNSYSQRSNVNVAIPINKTIKIAEIPNNNNFFEQSNNKNIRPFHLNANYQLNSKNKTNQSNNSSKAENQDNSILQTQYSGQMICYYCTKVVQSEFIATPCYHYYHDQCLREYYQFQLDNYNTNNQLICQCKIKLPQQFFSKSLQIDLNSLLQKQVDLIKQKKRNQIDYCVKCQFFWIKRINDTRTKKCWMCDQNGVILIQSN
ncbi:unnamed protein product [Paramecium primaurelia]|uniref:RING-type domain-containing protein n=1 Tax=Paramecium primaurelia TaxID=5886 RepID=A0A8S1M2J3_PARPR|nr:unnamed protein product [Paramecium primaurelia]